MRTYSTEEINQIELAIVREDSLTSLFGFTVRLFLNSSASTATGWLYNYSKN